MNNKKVFGTENLLYIVSLIIFFVLNYVLIGYGVAVIIPTVVIPVFLFGLSIKYGDIKTIITIIIGMIPYLILKEEGRLITSYIIYVLNFVGIKYIYKYAYKFDMWDNLLAITITSHMGIIITLIYTIITRYGGSLYNYFKEMEGSLKALTFYMLANNNNMLSKSEVMEYVNSITKENLSYMYPSMLIVSSIFVAYLTLRFLNFFLTYNTKNVKVNTLSEIKASPLILIFLMFFSYIGLVLVGNKNEIGKYMQFNGYYLLEILSTLVFLSYIIYILSTKFNIRGKFIKLVILFFIIPLMDMDVMIIFTILDSVFDFRNLTNYGLKRYFKSKAMKDREDKR